MTPRYLPTYDLAELGVPMDMRNAQGGQGRVYAVSGIRINGSWPVVLKLYKTDVRPLVDAATLRDIVTFLPELPPEQGRWLSDRTAWPAAVVTTGGAVCGCLMREVPGQFRLPSPSYRPGLRTARLAEVQFLLNSDDYLALQEIRLDDRLRLLLLRDLALSLSTLHRLGIVVGDLSAKNLLFSLAPQPGCFFIDCDGMRFKGRSAVPQTETPDWQLPSAGEEKATPASDAYKLALLAVRLFGQEQNHRDPAALATVSPELGLLAHTGLMGPSSLRPSPARWLQAIDDALVPTSPWIPVWPSGPVRSGVPFVPGTPNPSGWPGAPPHPAPRPPHPWRTAFLVGYALVVAVLGVVLCVYGVSVLD